MIWKLSSKTGGNSERTWFRGPFWYPFSRFANFWICEKGRRSYLSELKGPKRSLFVPYSTFSHLEGTIRTQLWWREGSLYRGSDRSSSNFALKEHCVCHFGTDETFSRWQRKIWSILIPVLLVLLERKKTFCTWRQSTECSLKTREKLGLWFTKHNASFCRCRKLALCFKNFWHPPGSHMTSY